MTVKHRKIKLITFSLNGLSFECQVAEWHVKNNSGDGERKYTACPDGEFIEDTEPDYTVEIKFFADWTLNGISDFLWQNNNQLAAIQLDHNPDIVGEHVRWAGTIKIKAPDAGGEVRGATEETDATMMFIGQPTYSRQ